MFRPLGFYIKFNSVNVRGCSYLNKKSCLAEETHFSKDCISVDIIIVSL